MLRRLLIPAVAALALLVAGVVTFRAETTGDRDSIELPAFAKSTTLAKRKQASVRPAQAPTPSWCVVPAAHATEIVVRRAQRVVTSSRERTTATSPIAAPHGPRAPPA